MQPGSQNSPLIDIREGFVDFEHTGAILNGRSEQIEALLFLVFTQKNGCVRM
jgi:hypothetical protein